MKQFVSLIFALESTHVAAQRLELLRSFFSGTEDSDGAVAISLLLSQTRKRILPIAKLRTIAEEVSMLPAWLIEESHAQVGDMAESIALLMGQHVAQEDPSLMVIVHEWLPALEAASPEEQVKILRRAWLILDREACVVWHKLITGSFHSNVTRAEIANALSAIYRTASVTIQHRLLHEWKRGTTIPELVRPEEVNITPYPYHLASPVDLDLRTIQLAEWHAEWYWSGLRAQLVKREGTVLLWTRKEEVVTDRLPEIVRSADELPEGSVLDGQLLVWMDNKPLPSSALERRLTRKATAAVMRELPVIFLAYDLLEIGGEDIRHIALHLRREQLEELLSTLSPGSNIVLSPVIDADSIEALREAHRCSEQHAAQGVVLKERNAPYGEGRINSWQKWKKEAKVIDAVLMYAERGEGGDLAMYSFGVWYRKSLVPIGKVAIEIPTYEKEELDAWIYENTLERFGPVRTVGAQQVFELEFDEMEESSRHKAGLVLRGIRVREWKREKPAESAASLADLRSLLR